jgi:hypothetical protein
VRLRRYWAKGKHAWPWNDPDVVCTRSAGNADHGNVTGVSRCAVAGSPAGCRNE